MLPGKQAPGGWGTGLAHPIYHSPTPTPLLVLVPPLAAAAVGPNRCDTIYQGFAECLIRLGDGMGRGGELETICRYQRVRGSGPTCATIGD